MKNINFKIVFLIVIVSVLLGLGFNAFSDKGIPFFPEEEKVVSDEALDEGVNEDISENTEEHKGEKVVSYQQVKDRIGDPNFVLIDARNSDDYSKSHIGEAVNIFPYDDEPVYFEKIYTLPRGKKYIIYCTGGNCDLSHKVAEDMRTSGFSNIFIYTGGWDEWSKNENLK